MTSVQSNDQRLLDRILDDQRRRQAPDQGRDRIARNADFTTKLRQSVISQSRFHIER